MDGLKAEPGFVGKNWLRWVALVTLTVVSHLIIAHRSSIPGSTVITASLQLRKLTAESRRYTTFVSVLNPLSPHY